MATAVVDTQNTYQNQDQKRAPLSERTPQGVLKKILTRRWHNYLRKNRLDPVFLLDPKNQHELITSLQENFLSDNSTIGRAEGEGALWVLFAALEIRSQWASRSTTSLADEINATNDEMAKNKGMSNAVLAARNKLPQSDPSATTQLPDDVYQYMKVNDIPVQTADGEETIDEYLGNNAKKPLNAGDLTVVQNSLDLYGTQLQNSTSNMNLRAQQATNNMTTLMGILTQILDTIKQIILKIINNL